jgi:hypothetical protein
LRVYVLCEGENGGLVVRQAVQPVTSSSVLQLFVDLLRTCLPVGPHTPVPALCSGNYQPTPTHHFIKLLHDKGLLLCCFTQNIDSLEHQVCFWRGGEASCEAATRGHTSREGALFRTQGRVMNPRSSCVLQKGVADPAVSCCVVLCCAGWPAPTCCGGCSWQL